MEEGSRIPLAGIACRDDLFTVGHADRHVQRVFNTMPVADVLDQSHHLLQGAARLPLQPEREREEEHDLGIRRPLDPAKQLWRDLHHQVTPQRRIFADQPVVGKQPSAISEWVTVGFLRGGVRGRTNVRDKQRRSNRPGSLTQVRIVPGGVQAAIPERHLRMITVPTDAKAVTVGRGVSQTRSQALVD